MMPIRNILVLAVLLSFAASCGGFKYKSSDALIADVLISEKHALLDVKDELAQLKQLRLKARSELNIAKRDRKAARAEYRIAKNGADKVQADVEQMDQERVQEDRLRQEIVQIEGRYQAEKRGLEVAQSCAPTQAVPPSPPLSAPLPLVPLS